MQKRMRFLRRANCLLAPIPKRPPYFLPRSYLLITMRLQLGRSTMKTLVAAVDHVYATQTNATDNNTAPMWLV